MPSTLQTLISFAFIGLCQARLATISDLSLTGQRLVRDNFYSGLIGDSIEVFYYFPSEDLQVCIIITFSQENGERRQKAVCGAVSDDEASPNLVVDYGGRYERFIAALRTAFRDIRLAPGDFRNIIVRSRNEIEITVEGNRVELFRDQSPNKLCLLKRESTASQRLERSQRVGLGCSRGRGLRAAASMTTRVTVVPYGTLARVQ
ncbi:hypothetical protein FOZ60_015463 [Perkinsus olseni]|uniref:Uncharacterized protein n=1 Tax=Perkinsus olseni TaxID=32597 RepID=A0A7J6P5U3_PEROL|nr:hypothetical protein FOZ60_015463 [Perkinsus olseni]